MDESTSSTTPGSSSNTSQETTSYQPRRGAPRGARGSRQRHVDIVTKKFLRNFDPERSEREKRKLNRRLYPGIKNKHVLYNEKGVFMQAGEDLCDCLDQDCRGCHFPCRKCSSTKCGHECRNNRKWIYESIENEGSDVVKKNPVLSDS